MTEAHCELTTKKCKPCEGVIAPLDRAKILELMKQLHSGWTLSEDSKEITRVFNFANFFETMAFVNACAWIAHRENHHPDLEAGYNYCQVKYSTHAIDGLSENDFICAAKVDELVA